MKRLSVKGHVRKHALFYLAVFIIWMKTYLTHRFQFELNLSGWLQELILFISPLSSIFLMLCVVLILVRYRLQTAAVIVSLLSGFILLANMLYYRFFNDFITLPVLLESVQIGELGGSIRHLLRASDFLVFTDTLILLTMSWGEKNRPVRMSKDALPFAVLLAGALFLLNLGMVQHIHPGLLARTFDRQIVVRSIGAYNYLVYDAVIAAEVGTKTASASSNDLAMVKGYLRSVPRDRINPAMFGAAKGRNVFLISLESLQSFVLDKRLNGQELTPYLNSLIRESYYFDQFYHQTGQGKTSDAEFLVDTMMYPLPSGAVFFTHTHNTYRSTPRKLAEAGYYPAVLHGNNKTFWNRDQMYRTLGYARFFSAEDYVITKENSVGWGLKDIPFFEQSVEKIRGLPQPFYVKLITLTNHYPFELKKEDRLIPQYDSKSKTLNRYVTTVRYMDEAVKRFFEEVQAAGLYDNSTFILYGDHYGISHKHRESMARFLDKEKLTAFDHAELQRVPLIIHIPGQQGKTISVVGGQVDLQPTLLHLLGIASAPGTGFGHDLFALNKPDFAVFRDGSFVTDQYVFTGSKCYLKSTGEQTDPQLCEPLQEQAQNHLKFSDKIIYGDLNRFLGSMMK